MLHPIFALIIPAIILTAITYPLSQAMEVMDRQALLRTVSLLFLLLLVFIFEIILDGDHSLPARVFSWWLSHWKT